ncbi:MAG: hypothetical protein ACI4UF_03105 [Thermoguttaceae bacterium]
MNQKLKAHLGKFSYRLAIVNLVLVLTFVTGSIAYGIYCRACALLIPIKSVLIPTTLWLVVIILFVLSELFGLLAGTFKSKKAAVINLIATMVYHLYLVLFWLALAQGWIPFGSLVD